MCENRDGKIVVGNSAGMGWWIGQITEKEAVLSGRPLSLVNIMWVERAENKCSSIFTENFKHFETPEEAMAFVQSQ